MYLSFCASNVMEDRPNVCVQFVSLGANDKMWFCSWLLSKMHLGYNMRWCGRHCDSVVNVHYSLLVSMHLDFVHVDMICLLLISTKDIQNIVTNWSQKQRFNIGPVRDAPRLNNDENESHLIILVLFSFSYIQSPSLQYLVQFRLFRRWALLPGFHFPHAQWIDIFVVFLYQYNNMSVCFPSLLLPSESNFPHSMHCALLASV